MRKKQLKEEDFYNWWLKKYHNTTIEELLEKEPELMKTQGWYDKYAVKQKEHDVWYCWAIETIMKHYRCSRKRAERDFAFAYLNVAPAVREYPQYPLKNKTKN